MPGFLYYIPGATTGVKLPQWREAGLGYLPLAGERRDVRGGPDGGEGVLCAVRPGVDVRYDAAGQRWQQIPGGKAWVGLATAHAPPGPADLEREQSMPGHEIELLDGERWLAPVVRRHVEEDGLSRYWCTLPRSCQIDATGQWAEGAVVAAWRPLWDLACRWDDARTAAALGVRELDGRHVATFEFGDVLSDASRALGANYLVGAVEVSLLGLLSFDLAASVLDWLVDLPTRVAWLKKKLAAEPAGASLSAGPEASIATTDPR